MRQKLLRVYQRLASIIPLTWQGSFLLLSSLAVVYFYGVQSEDWILLIVGLFGLTLPILSVVSVGISALWLRYRLQKLNPKQNALPLQTDTAHSVRTDFKLPRFVLPFLDFLPTWEYPKANVTDVVVLSQRTEQVSFPRRGSYQKIIRRFTLSDLFGLAEVRWHIHESRDVEVWPHLHSHQPPFARAFVEGSDRFVASRPRRGDFVDTRAYIPGDPIRLIHWKLFARSNQPFIRIPEPAASFEHQILAYLVTDDNDKLAACAARWDLEYGHLGEDWKFGTDNCDKIASDIHTSRRLLALSGSAEPVGGKHLNNFLKAVNFQADQHRLMIYASGDIGAWLPQVMPILRKHTGLISIIIASEDNISARHFTEESPSTVLAKDTSQESEAAWKRLFLKPLPPAVEIAPRWWEQLQQLHRDGLQIQFIHLSQV